MSLGNSTLLVDQQSLKVGMSVPDVREAFDQGELMLNGPALRFGALLGSENILAGGSTSGYTRSNVLVDLLGRSALLQGDLSRFVISKHD